MRRREEEAQEHPLTVFDALWHAAFLVISKLVASASSVPPRVSTSLHANGVPGCPPEYTSFRVKPPLCCATIFHSCDLLSACSTMCTRILRRGRARFSSQRLCLGRPAAGVQSE